MRKPQVNPTGCPCLNPVPLQDLDPRDRLRRPGVKPDKRAVLERTRHSSENPDPNINGKCRTHDTRKRHDRTSSEFFGCDTRQVDCNPSSWAGNVHLGPMALETTRTRPEPGREHFKFLSNFKAAVAECPSHDRAETCQGEHPVYRQAWTTKVATHRRVIKYLPQRRHEFRQTAACQGRYWHD